ncbi:MAG: monovalent cation/H(+) antiporter subunit G [Deltaproteobacteria bacterium]|nr:monovalent cation/H(+) antiporter subunit G [Deltaproteobacteria bacterium]MBW2019000.1 monovalent cation/H(+) antiporter subunit G [Deltaproteobacteria bacterium]MBW2073590.1 monovalent cation/H(+) antiporter subunit G [Deltaproteobacteria bacterium]RLB82694.1 MAG: sodium:proton antiporter [Deltaproteobacteria bacterium]
MNIIVTLLLFAGLFFFTGGAVGILRFPDFYSRLHPAGKLDTLGSLLAITALALFNLHHFSIGTLLTSIKIILILVFVFLASPTATHAIVDAGVRAGLAPWVKGEERR